MAGTSLFSDDEEDDAFDDEESSDEEGVDLGDGEEDEEEV